MKNRLKFISGSLSVESAIILPFICFLFLVFIGSIQIVIGKMDIKYLTTEISYKIKDNIGLIKDEKDVEFLFLDYLNNKMEYENINNMYISKLVVISDLKFSGTDVSKDKNTNSKIIDINVNYSIKPLVLSKLFPKIFINERTFLKYEIEGKKIKYIWDENHIKRGIEIQYIFGKNVLKPVNGEFFRFDISNYEAIEMRTLDPTLKSYQRKGAVTASVKKDILKFANYNNSISVISDKGEIVKYTIKSRKFLLVIPENTINESLESELVNLQKVSKDEDINFELIKYGIKY